MGNSISRLVPVRDSIVINSIIKQRNTHRQIKHGRRLRIFGAARRATQVASSI